MWIGVGRLVIEIWGNDSLKHKRKWTKELCKDIQKEYNISILEVADHEDPERCVLGFGVVISENWELETARQFVQKICKTIDETAFARVTVTDWDILEH